MQGQLLDDERAFLYWVVCTVQPQYALEIGTWKGGGSTFQIASAIKCNGFGHLHTCEQNTEIYNQAVVSYLNHKLRKFISFYNMSSSEFLDRICRMLIPDFAFFDGGEDPQLTLDDFITMDSFMLPGAIFMAHDWDIGEGLSRKNELLRPHLESNKNWRIIQTLTKPHSVGMVYAQKINR